MDDTTVPSSRAMATSSESGVINLASPYSVDDTAQRLMAVLEHAGMTVFARIDQRGAAQAVGLTMRPMMLVLFGNPKAGTPLLQTYPTLAIDLPLKALVWEDADGRVWLSTNSPQYLQNRHSMTEAPFVGVTALLERALQSSKPEK